MADSDAMDMRQRIDHLPDQLRQSGEFVAGLDWHSLASCRRVLLCGMGGSAAAGALLAGVYENEVDLRVSRRYEPPRPWLDEALVIFSSYSGNTEETLSAYDQLAGRARARLVLSSGGRLAEKAESDGVGLARVPPGWPPRSTLGWGVGVLARVLGHLGFADDVETDLEDCAVLLERRRDALESERRDSGSTYSRLLAALEAGFPLLYASDGLTEAVALRWRAQLNENAKILCGHALLPELDHNEVVGYEAPAAFRPAAVIALRDRDEAAGVARRFEITREVLGAAVPRWEELRADDGSRLARALQLVQIGDYLSVELAERAGIDPTPVRSIDELKRRLAG